MSNFIIRVVLHDASLTDYVSLQKKLAAFGVVDVVLATDGKRYKLPPAEYIYSGNESAEVVRQACVNTASSTGRKFSVLVTQALNIVWHGLSVVT